MSEEVANTETALTLSEAEQHIAEVANLTSRALQIAQGAPHWKYIGSDEASFAYVVIDGKEATLSWPEIERGYEDSTSLESYTLSFPARLLFLSHADFLAWKADEFSKYNEGQAEKRRREQAMREAQERATFEELKRKYETRP